jgi:hypothetical protein
VQKTKTVHVQVTQQDINQGRPYSPSSCPIALALKRATKAGYVSVGPARADITVYRLFRKDASYLAPLPTTAAKFIETFDNYHTHLTVKPFEFDLELERGN